MEYQKSAESDGLALAEIRAAAMKPSLVALGRYDEARVRTRFLETFDSNDTWKIVDNGELLGFYVVRVREDHHYLDHLYIKAEHQNRQVGKTLLERIISEASAQGVPVRLGALKGSRANDFYVKHGFRKTHEDEYDLYYEYSAHDH